MTAASQPASTPEREGASAPARMFKEGSELAKAIIAKHSKSFALASRLLPPRERTDGTLLYAWCRRVDDSVDAHREAATAATVDALFCEIDALHSTRPLADPLLLAFRDVVTRRAIARVYMEELVRGMDMDVRIFTYATLRDLLVYCYRVAGTVGLMMCHVLGVRSDDALIPGARLGIAMQLTNIARDVLEDWNRGRLYLPQDVLCRHGAENLASQLAQAFPDENRSQVAAATAEVLTLADAYYAASEEGFGHLEPRVAFAIRAARAIYAAIGQALAKQAYDPLAPRAYVRSYRKFSLTANVAYATLVHVFQNSLEFRAPSKVPETVIPSMDATFLP